MQLVLGDLGRTPLSVLYKYRYVKFWLNIVHDNETRLRNAMYKVLGQLDEQRGNTFSCLDSDMCGINTVLVIK